MADRIAIQYLGLTAVPVPHYVAEGGGLVTELPEAKIFHAGSRRTQERFFGKPGRYKAIPVEIVPKEQADD